MPDTPSAACSCDQPMRGLYGATSLCARPAGHVGKHDPIWDHKDWPTEGEPVMNRTPSAAKGYTKADMERDTMTPAKQEARYAATVEFEEQHAHNMHILGLIRDEPAWALARILRCEALEARRHYTRRMLQALDAYWRCHDGHPGRRGRYDLEDWWTRLERYRALVEESIVV